MISLRLGRIGAARRNAPSADHHRKGRSTAQGHLDQRHVDRDRSRDVPHGAPLVGVRDRAPEVNRALVAADLDVHRLEAGSDLERIFLSLTQG